MEKIISSIPVYNLLTNLIPGTVLAALLKFCMEDCDIFSLTDNIWILAVILYFLGIINSRISSLIFEPLMKKLKIVNCASHADFTDAELKDTSGKLTQLSRMNNEYRSYLSVFAIVLILKLIFLCSSVKGFVTDNVEEFILGLGVLLFLCSYKKQVSYITSRVSRLNNKH